MLFTTLLWSIGIHAQVQGDSALIITSVEATPEFQGGTKGLIDHMATHLVYPPGALEAGIEGVVRVVFWVDTTGATYDHAVLSGVQADLDAEALRLARSLHFETPALQRGKPVRYKYTFPVRFSLDGGKRQGR